MTIASAGPGTGPEGFDEAFPVLYRQARRLAERILGDATTAEDVASEAMARAFADWGKVGRSAYRDAWVMRVTANVAIDLIRRRKRHPTLSPPPNVEAIDESIVLRSALMAALARLPRRQCEVLVLTYFVGLSPGEAATALGISASSVAQHARRGLRRLRDELGSSTPLILDPGGLDVPI